MDIIKSGNSLLTTKSEAFDFTNPPVDPVELAHMLAQTMLKHNGLGLSAIQIGIPYRVFTMKTNPIMTCFNPKIIDIGEGDVLLEEGCLSYPNLFVKIKRPNNIRVRFTLPNGETVTEKYTGITSRIFQHELDHLDGIVYTRRANLYHLEQAKRQQQKINSGKLRVQHQVHPQPISDEMSSSQITNYSYDSGDSNAQPTNPSTIRLA